MDLGYDREETGYESGYKTKREGIQNSSSWVLGESSENSRNYECQVDPARLYPPPPLIQPRPIKLVSPTPSPTETPAAAPSGSSAPLKNVEQSKITPISSEASKIRDMSMSEFKMRQVALPNKGLKGEEIDEYMKRFDGLEPKKRDREIESLLRNEQWMKKSGEDLRKEINQTQYKDVLSSLKKKPTDLDEVEEFVDKLPPGLRDKVKEKLPETYAKVDRRTLTEKPFNFSEKDALAIGYARGLRNPDGSIKEGLDLKTVKAEMNHLLKTSPGDLRSSSVDKLRDKLSGEMARIGMKGDQAAKYMARQGYFKDDASPGKIMEDLAKAEKVPSDKNASNDLAKKWIEDGKYTTMPSSPAEGALYRITAHNIDKSQKPGLDKKPNPQIEADKNILEQHKQSNKNLNFQQKKLDLETESLAETKKNNAAVRENQKAQLAENKRQFNERQAFEKDKTEKDRDLQREQMKQNMISKILELIMHMIGQAMQILGQTASAHISGQYQMQASILGKMGSHGRG
jgi:hypothetical protein